MADPTDKVPEPTLSRLSLYVRRLRYLLKEGVKTVSSADIEERCGIGAVQIRKDLSYFGEFGKPGTGYDVEVLFQHLTEIMQLDREHRLIVVGAGNLGAAIVGYSGFAGLPFRVVGIFDNNVAKIGRCFWDLHILDVNDLAEANKELQADIGIIAVPAEAAQQVADLLVEAGARAILNFAPTHLTVREDIALREVDLTQELEVLCYHIDRLPARKASGHSGR